MDVGLLQEGGPDGPLAVTDERQGVDGTGGEKLMACKWGQNQWVVGGVKRMGPPWDKRERWFGNPGVDGKGVEKIMACKWGQKKWVVGGMKRMGPPWDKREGWFEKPGSMEARVEEKARRFEIIYVIGVSD